MIAATVASGALRFGQCPVASSITSSLSGICRCTYWPTAVGAMASSVHCSTSERVRTRGRSARLSDRNVTRAKRRWISGSARQKLFVELLGELGALRVAHDHGRDRARPAEVVRVEHGRSSSIGPPDGLADAVARGLRRRGRTVLQRDRGRRDATAERASWLLDEARASRSARGRLRAARPTRRRTSCWRSRAPGRARRRAARRGRAPRRARRPAALHPARRAVGSRSCRSGAPGGAGSRSGPGATSRSAPSGPPRWCSDLVPLQQLLADHHALDLRGALADQQQRRVAVEPLDLVLLRVAVAAVDAEGSPRRPPCRSPRRTASPCRPRGRSARRRPSSARP